MSKKILVGPLLGLESNTRYTFCFLTSKSVQTAIVNVGNTAVTADCVAETSKGRFWRAEFEVSDALCGGQLSYDISLDNVAAKDVHNRTSWQFHVPGLEDKPRIAYASCNGFSSLDLKNKTEDPYSLWRDMLSQHQEHPFSLLMMGGDQLYADELWTTVPFLRKWGELPHKDKIERKATKTLITQLDSFYEKLYLERWGDKSMSLMLASIPSVMMWDDHDIFDGWGSYPKDLHECPVYQAIFATARKYFEIFQVRSLRNTSLFRADGSYYAFAFQFRGYNILSMDNRAERSLEQIMGKLQWEDINRYLEQTVNDGDLLVLSAVPVVYRDFSFTETVFDATPWEEELTDDLKDHWRSKEHQGERARLIMRLLDNAAKRQGNGSGRTVLLSGDVHLGCIGVVNDQRNNGLCKIHQIVSSGIVHPAPSRIQWLGIMAVTNDDDEYLNEDHTIRISMLKPFGSRKYIRSRNYITLLEGTDQKLWVNWVCDNKDKPYYPLTA